jgi:hypothetical protein
MKLLRHLRWHRMLLLPDPPSLGPQPQKSSLLQIQPQLTKLILAQRMSV